MIDDLRFTILPETNPGLFVFNENALKAHNLTAQGNALGLMVQKKFKP